MNSEPEIYPEQKGIEKGIKEWPGANFGVQYVVVVVVLNFMNVSR